jgi:uncharacterized protein YgiB involved in biofilm formation
MKHGRGAGLYSESACRTAIEAAQREHVTTAPRFASRQDCEASFGSGACGPSPENGLTQGQGQQPPVQQPPGQQQTASSGGSSFMPLFMGYMMGRAMSGNGMFSQPLYRQPGTATGLATAGGQPVAARTGVQAMPASTLRSAQAPAVQRGGFGSSAQRFGGATS